MKDNLADARILIAAQYAAPYAGNFIVSLSTLEADMRRQHKAVCAYVFPREAEARVWVADFAKNHKCYFVSPHEKEALADVAAEFNPDFIYTHFEGYDNAFSRWKGYGECRLIWHMHDTLAYVRHPIKAAYQSICFFRHYGLPFLVKRARHPAIIVVDRHESEFIAPYRLGVRARQTVIPNGISIDRLSPGDRKGRDSNRPFTFLTFGGRNIQKRIDLAIKAAQILEDKAVGGGIKLLITNGMDTAKVVGRVCGEKMPLWLSVIEQTSDISSLYRQADCFISGSDHETFSYAIAEASISGLPVIQSDIEGTKWNESNPSTFVFPKGNAKALADRMLEVMEYNPSLLAEKCEITKANNIANYSLPVWSKRIIDFFNGLQ